MHRNSLYSDLESFIKETFVSLMFKICLGHLDN